MYQNLAVIFQQFNYGKNSFIVLILGRFSKVRLNDNTRVEIVNM